MKALLRTLAVAGALLPFAVFSANDLSEGTIRKVDADTQRLRIAHGPIANLNMPPMTMAFRVKEAAMLQGLKEGDKVRFRVERIDGAYTIVRIEAAK